MRWFTKFVQDEQAATAVEYAVMLALVVGACLVAIGTLGLAVMNIWVQGRADMNAAGF